MKKGSWQILRKGDPNGPLTLTVDFTSTGRTQACFRDLVPLITAPGEIWETTSPSGGAEDEQTGADYVARWARLVRKRDRVVSTVVGYCAGACFAAPLADALAETQDRPRLILVDPELPNIVGLYRDYHAAADALKTILNEDELAKFHADGEEVREKYGVEDLSLIGPALAGSFREVTELAGERLGLDEDLRAELSDSFASFVGYLRAATQLDPIPGWRTATAISSVHNTVRDLTFGESVRLDVDHDQMLRHPDVAKAVSDRMAGEAPGDRLAS